MPEVYIALEAAAEFEGIKYKTLTQRIARNPEQFHTKTAPREAGGKDMVLVSLSSLSAKARRAYRAAQKVGSGPAPADQPPGEAPWYVTADLSGYIKGHKKAFYEAVELAARLQDFMDYTGPDRTGYGERFALDLGISHPTLYRYLSSVLEANVWAQRLEAEGGESRDYFRVLALCRRPREKDTFPSLTDEMKAVIENIWFNRDFANNLGTLEMLYEYFVEEGQRRGWAQYPSAKTAARYVNYLMDRPGAKSARYLAANGLREWKNKEQLKGKRNASTLDVMEYLVADAHLFDVWVEYTAPNGKIKAIRPTLVAWMDMRSRRFLGCIMCEHSNAQVVKQSVVKMVYEAGCAPVHLHMDNGKDFTSGEVLGQERSKRAIDTQLMDAQWKGFYLAMGAKTWSRSKPFQPWDKPIERAFHTFCLKYSRKFKSYVGTLTGSKTEAKRKKDIARMLARGELLTMAEFMAIFETWLTEKYNKRIHRGLTEFEAQWHTPELVWENAPRCNRAAPPREYAAMLLMKPDTAHVTTQGITKWKTLYTAPELAYYIGQTVGIRWDVDDVTKLYVYDHKTGEKICEAHTAQLLEFGDRVSQAALEALHKNKNQQLATVRDILNGFNLSPEERVAQQDGGQTIVGTMDLMIGHAPKPKIIALPTDKEYRGEVSAATRKRSEAADGFLTAKGGDALKRLQAMNE